MVVIVSESYCQKLTIVTGKKGRSKEEQTAYKTKTKLIQQNLKKANWFFQELDFDLENLDKVHRVMKGDKKHFLWKAWKKLNRVLKMNPMESFFSKKSLLNKVIREKKGYLLCVQKEDFKDSEDFEDFEDMD